MADKTQGANAPQEISDNTSQAALILAGISQAIFYADQDAGNLTAVSNWLSLIDAATNKVHQLLTGFPLGWEDGAVTTLIPEEAGEVAA